MQRFYDEVSVVQTPGGWQVALDGRPIKTQRGSAQLVPSEALAQRLADEWRAQGEKIDPRSLPLRDLVDFAIDVIRPDRSAAIAKLTAFAQTDTLCYRADPDEPSYRRQRSLWEPIVTACETRHGVTFERISGVMHRAQPDTTMAKLKARLESEDEFALAALTTMASISASLITALAALDQGAEATDLFTAANAEEDWQAELWGWDDDAKKTRAARLEAFELAAELARLMRAS